MIAVSQLSLFTGTVQLDLNLTLAVLYPRVKPHVLPAHNQDHAFFVDLHANGNPLRVTHERTVHEDASLGKRYTPASTSNTQVTRVHASKKGDTQVRLPLSISALWYLRGINHHSIGLFTR